MSIRKFIYKTLKALDFKERLSISLFILLYFAFFTWLFYSIIHIHSIFYYMFKIMQIVNTVSGAILGVWTFNKLEMKGKGK